MKRWLLVAALGLAGCGGGSGGGGVPREPGVQLFDANCSACHGRDGQGLGNAAQPSLVQAPVVAGPVEEMVAWVLYGRRPASLPRGKYVGIMPQFSWLSDDDAALLLSHVRTHFGNHYGPVSADDVRRVREARQ